jgi:alpha-L-fucosidase
MALSAGKKATTSNVYQNSAAYDAGKACDDNDETRWATDSGTHAAWLEIDLGKPCLIGRAVLQQAFPELKRIRKFAVEAYLDSNWKSVYTGSDPGAELEMNFTPVMAQRVRLNITESAEGPTIWEFRVFPPRQM